MLELVARAALPLADLDRYWAHFLGCKLEELRAGRPRFRPGSDPAIQVFLTSDGGVVIAPPPVLELVQGDTAAAPRLTLDQLLDVELWAAHLQLQPDKLASHVTSIAYTTGELFRPRPHPFVRRLKRYDAEALARFGRIITASEGRGGCHWTVGGRTLGGPETYLWGAYFEGRLVAVAGVRRLSDQIAEIGVDTLPKHRGQGYGTAVAAAATNAALKAVPLVQWSARQDNRVSERVARRLGYRTYAHQLWLALPA